MSPLEYPSRSNAMTFARFGVGHSWPGAIGSDENVGVKALLRAGMAGCSGILNMEFECGVGRVGWKEKLILRGYKRNLGGVAGECRQGLLSTSLGQDLRCRPPYLSEPLEPFRPFSEDLP